MVIYASTRESDSAQTCPPEKSAKNLKKDADMLIAIDVTHGETPDEKRDMVFTIPLIFMLFQAHL